MTKYTITAEWIMRAIVEVEADSAENAIEKVYNEDLPEGGYADGTLEIADIIKE